MTKHGARVLLNRFKEEKMDDPTVALDSFMANCINRGYLKAFASHPSIFIQNTSTGSMLRNNTMACFFNNKECAIPYNTYWYIFLLIFIIVIFLIVIILSRR